MTSGEPVFRRVEKGQEDEVLTVLNETAAWLASEGVQQWPGRFERAWIQPWVTRPEGRSYLRLDCVASNLRLRPASASPAAR